MNEIAEEITEKYDNAFGYIKGFLVLLGIFMLGSTGYVLWNLLSESVSVPKELVEVIVFGIIVLGTLVLIVWHTWSKCPPDHRGIVGLIFSMAFVGLMGIVWLQMNIFIWVVELLGNSETERVGSGTESERSQKLTYSYYRESDGEPCTLYSSLNENFATLRDSHGNSISVYRDGSTEFLRDDSGNYYRPN